jgi:hypothetical protein
MTNYPGSAAENGEYADLEWWVGNDPPEDGMPVGTAMGLLADDTRRYLLYALAASPDRSAPTDELVSEVLFRDDARRADDPHDRRTVRVAVRHAHLPKLRDAGVVEYESGAERVSYCPPDTFEKLLSYASMVENRATP